VEEKRKNALEVGKEEAQAIEENTQAKGRRAVAVAPARSGARGMGDAQAKGGRAVGYSAVVPSKRAG